MTAPVFTVRDVRLYERDVHLRLPFRFGVVTLTEAPQVFVRARIELADGRSYWGAAAEMLVPKWFDKNLALSNEANFEQLRLALALAAAAYTDSVEPRTAFGHFAANYERQITDGARTASIPWSQALVRLRSTARSSTPFAGARAAPFTMQSGAIWPELIQRGCRRMSRNWLPSTCCDFSRL
jgi:hypothetical protein